MYHVTQILWQKSMLSELFHRSE